MTSVAVVAHAKKQLGGGLPALREALAQRGVTEPIWYEVRKSKQAPKRVRQALERGSDLVFAWGGDGTVQRCIDTMAGGDAALAVLPAGTANLLANNLGIPTDLDRAVEVGLYGARRRIDAGTVNGEHWAVMAGAGFDARLIRDAGRSLKDRVGRLGYVLTGAKNLRHQRVETRIEVDGTTWFRGGASCVLFANVGKILGGVEAFPSAQPDDGRIELGVVTADGLLEWTRTLARTAVGNAARSPFVETTSGREFDVKFDRKTPYELDGGDRKETKRLRVAVEPGAVTVCVPDEAA